MEKRKTYEVESMDDLRQMIEELPDGVILEVSVKEVKERHDKNTK